MSREEEIRNKAVNDQKSLMESMDWRAGFISGAKWADENTQDIVKMRKDYEFLFMLKKKELIQKACEWWEQRQEDYVLCDAWNHDYISFKSMIMDFREAMEDKL